MTSAIEVHGLKKTYSLGLIGKRQFQSLAGIDLTVAKGEVFGLLGPNGAGKTTLIKILLGIIRSSGGTASVLGHAAGSRSARKHVGYLPENLNLPPHQTAISALQYYGRLSRMPEDVIRARGQELIELVGLKGRDRESVARFSKGMRQRLGLAQAMLHDPELLILDEPTDGLDPVARSQIRQLISRFRDQGKTVFLNSHILQEVEQICDRVAILVKGEIRGVGRPRELAEQMLGAIEGPLRLEVVDTEQKLVAALSQFDANCSSLSNGRQQVMVKVKEQADVDRLIDSLRSHGISILHLQRETPNLERVFLSLVQDAPSAEEEDKRASA